jgi:hypothetical protein
MTSAVSSMVRPPKNRSSTNRPFRGSSHRFDRGEPLDQRDPRATAPTLSALAPTRMIDKEPPHQLGCNAKEVRAVLPLDVLLPDQLQVGLVNEGCRLQRMAGPLAREISLRQPLQLVIHDRHQLVERLPVSLSALDEQLSQVLR